MRWDWAGRHSMASGLSCLTPFNFEGPMVKKNWSQALFWLQGCLHRACPQVGGAVVGKTLTWRCNEWLQSLASLPLPLPQGTAGRDEWGEGQKHNVCDGKGGLSRGSGRKCAVFSHRGHGLALNLVIVHWSGHRSWFILRRRKVEGKVWAHICPHPCWAPLKSQAWLHINVINEPKCSFCTEEKTED